MTNCFALPHVTVKSEAELVGWFVSAHSYYSDLCSGGHFLHLLGEMPQPNSVSAGSELKVLYKSITVAH